MSEAIVNWPAWDVRTADKEPFIHWTIDGFFRSDVVARLVQEFPPYDSSTWFTYATKGHIKKTCNSWYSFPESTYKVFSYLTSPAFVAELSDLVGVDLVPDYGLHGGGWHAHQNGGELNPHLDYSIHPKLGLQRKLNLLVYLSLMTEENGGHLGLWEGDSEKPEKLVKEIAPFFNRAVLFDTTQNSWHGMSRPLALPYGETRRSIAVYYLCEAEGGDPTRQRAKFVERPDEQQGSGI